MGIVLASIASCAPVMRVHGYVPTRSDLDQIVVGADTKLSIEEIAGQPSDTGLRDENAWYYVSSTVRNFMFLEPKVVERTVLAFDFDNDGVLTAISEYGLDDGRVIDLETRVTPTDRRRAGILSVLFGNLGGPTLAVPN